MMKTSLPHSYASSRTPGRILFVVSLLVIVLAAAWLRAYELDWDEGTHLHPDERYLTMVVSAITFPEDPSQYWDTATSPLNPTNNPSFAGYVYGTLPLFTTRAAAQVVDQACGDTPTRVGRWLRVALLGTDVPCMPGHYVGYSGIHLVGRALSALADLAALLGLALMAHALYGRRVSLLAAAFYAFAVLPIQHAHFFVVDSFATVFVVWTLCVLVWAVHERQTWLLPLAGLTTGLAVASKISVWPLAGIVGLAALLERDERGAYRVSLRPGPIVAVILSGMLAAVAFRAAQPYAFTGPGFFNVRIYPQWLATMRDIRELVSGLRDVPYGHQWTARAPIFFPWRNMVFWGLGLPLGLAAWGGWAVMAWHLLRKGRWQHLLLWLWGTLFFLYQGTQWVKSMRYLLPIYPVFALFAAWVLDRALRQARELKARRHPAWRALRIGLLALPWLVLAGTLAWALAFMQIYVQPFTRVAASRWIYRHVPAAATLQTHAGPPIQVPLRPDTQIQPSRPLSAVFSPEDDVAVKSVRLNRMDSGGNAGARQLRITLAGDPQGEELIAEATASAILLAEGPVALEIPLPDAVALAKGQHVYLTVQLLEGAPFSLRTSILANEHWDDALPQRIDGKDAFGNWYRSLSSSPRGQMNNYDNDTLEKRQQLFNWLDEADYIMLSSNRLYASIPRLPLRYPFTTAYYEALFAGRLGYELAAEFVSFPALGPCQFPDQEMVFGLMPPRTSNARPCSIPYPPAEEAFSVYDHPTVLIFAKTPAYSRARVEAELPTSLLNNVQWMTPLEATRGRSGPSRSPDQPTLLMDARTRAVQEAGGTWSSLFNRDALRNRWQVLAVVLWWIMVTFLGLLAFPWLYHAFPALRYRGYGLTKAVGLLLWSYLAWILASLRILPHTPAMLWGVLFVMALASALWMRARWPAFRAFFREHWRDLLRIELLFAALYVGWVLVRYLNPDLWHPVAGGEKPMDFAYLNAVIKSTWFPPYDPWFAGGVMNYYYFGFVVLGSLIKALGIVPSIAYNLAVPTLFALTGVGAYAVANTLSGTDRRRGHRAGLFAVLLVLLLGNLGELRLIFKGLVEVGGIQFESLIPGYPDVVSALAGLWRVVVQGQALAFRPEWWYWDASRVIPVKPGEVGPINEFPAFTFLYADLHAHAMALPFTQIALAVALQWALGTPRRSYPRTLRGFLHSLMPRPLPALLLGGLVAGTLRATNTWDWPTYLALMGLSPLLSFLRSSDRATSTPCAPDIQERACITFPWHRLTAPALVFLLGEVLFRPFTHNFAAAYTSFLPWEGSRTPVSAYLVMHGHFIFPLAVLALVRLRGVLRGFAPKAQGEPAADAEIIRAQPPEEIGAEPADDGLRDTPGSSLGDQHALFGFGIAGASMLVLLMTLLALGVPVAWIVVPLGTVAALLLLAPQSSARTRLLWLWVGTALALSLVVEIIVLKGDIGRMNTVFKFYLQVWMLLGLSAAVAVERIFHRALWDSARNASRIPDVLVDGVFGVMVLLLFAAALYPALAIPAKARDRWAPAAPRSLDGMAFVPYAKQIEHGLHIPLEVDYRVIRWFQENVEGSPTIIEGQAEREYLWGNRVSVYTGLPSVAAWRWHQVQQRQVMPPGTVEDRQYKIRYFYSTPSPEEARSILQLFDVRYVVFTRYERAYMMPEGEAKFATMVDNGWLKVVYQEPEATVYEVVR